MQSRNDLCDWLIEALKAHNGSASIVEICKYVWNHHEQDLKSAGDLFYSWQYDIRWAATQLRKKGSLRDEKFSPRGVWELT